VNGYDRPSALGNRRRKPAPGAPGITAISELGRNPVEFTVAEGGQSHQISAERGPSGKVWLTCQCDDGHANGWCQHRIELLCFRYDQIGTTTAEARRAFEAIVTGTTLGNAGRDADRALSAFAQCLKVFDQRRPANPVGRDLGKFTDLVSDLATAAGELEDALGNLRRLLERA
jgi:hypothetical protein